MKIKVWKNNSAVGRRSRWCFYFSGPWRREESTGGKGGKGLECRVGRRSGLLVPEQEKQGEGGGGDAEEEVSLQIWSRPCWTDVRLAAALVLWLSRNIPGERWHPFWKIPILKQAAFSAFVSIPWLPLKTPSSPNSPFSPLLSGLPRPLWSSLWLLLGEFQRFKLFNLLVFVFSSGLTESLMASYSRRWPRTQKASLTD